MSKDVDCPYCGKGNDIIHDDGYGYEEDRIHQQECCHCDKTFVFKTLISFDYDADKADCLNGGEHEFKPTKTFPVECTEMECTMCEDRRPLTDAEWKSLFPQIVKP